MTLVWSGRFEESVHEYRKVKPLPAEPKGMDGDVPDWIVRWELAKSLGYGKRYEESLHEYKKLCKEKPRLYEARVEMATILFWLGKRDYSLHILKRIPQNKMNDETRLLVADLSMARKD